MADPLLPERANGYAVTVQFEYSPGVWNAAFGDVHARLTALETWESDLASLVQDLSDTASQIITDNVAPQLAQVADDVAAIAQTITNLETQAQWIIAGTAPDAAMLGGLSPADYRDAAKLTGTLPDERLSFSVSDDGKALIAAATLAAMRSLLAVYSQAETDSAIATALAGLVSAAPGQLDTLNELAEALGDDPNFAATITANAVFANAARALTAGFTIQPPTAVEFGTLTPNPAYGNMQDATVNGNNPTINAPTAPGAYTIVIDVLVDAPGFNQITFSGFDRADVDDLTDLQYGSTAQVSIVKSRSGVSVQGGGVQQ